jgi:hypothetical protein
VQGPNITIRPFLESLAFSLVAVKVRKNKFTFTEFIFSFIQWRVRRLGKLLVVQRMYKIVDALNLIKFLLLLEVSLHAYTAH